MRIKMITTSAGPDGVRQPGSVYDVPKAEAEALIEAHAAVPVKAIERAVKPVPETTAGAPQQ